MADERPPSTLSLVLGQPAPAPAPPEPPTLEGATIAGRYRVEGALGAGATGTVYRVRHATLGTRHALKVVAAPSPVVTERLLREGRLQAQLDHPNVVKVTDVVTDGVTALVLELVEGPTLAERLRAGRPPWPEVLAIARDVIRGVRAAHALGVVHRDLKPANVLLAPGPGGAAVARVTDFGLAHSASDPGLTAEGAVLGTPAYMAPEQLVDPRGVDARADVWALGAVLYELATGERPFGGGALAEVAGQVALGRYRPPRELAPDLPPSLEAAIRGALVVDPSARLPDCDALLAALDRPAPAGPSAARIGGAAAGALALAVAVGLVVGWLRAAPAGAPDRAAPAAPLPVPVAAATPALPAPRPAAPAPAAATAPESPRPSRPPPAPAPLPAAVAAPPAPAPVDPGEPPPPPAPGWVELGGEVRPRIELRGPGGPRGPGEVPPGRWDLFADFGGGYAPQGPLTVPPGGRIVLQCHSMKRTCAPR